MVDMNEKISRKYKIPKTMDRFKDTAILFVIAPNIHLGRKEMHENTFSATCLLSEQDPQYSADTKDLFLLFHDGMLLTSLFVLLFLIVSKLHVSLKCMNINYHSPYLSTQDYLDFVTLHNVTNIMPCF